jgi:hypothetical protein
MFNVLSSQDRIATTIATQKENKDRVRSRLGPEARFQVGGPLLWNCIDLGQTVMFYPTWIYTDSVTKIEHIKIDAFKYKLIPQKYHDNIVPEWATIDMLNHRTYLQTPHDVLMMHLHSQLENSLLDVELLVKLANEYGTAETKADIEAAVQQSK